MHKNFLVKVVAVLGEETSAKFLAHVNLGVGQQKFLHTHIHPQNGQSYPMYTLPKREATLMAMSYSSIISAAVYDRMTALEDELVKKVVHAIPQTLAASGVACN
ncbi:hypothetical protein [Pseudomonas psychrophila]|uniref:hypothetical protein n=1 Tax=Pseudomonas psychrophila TaxID=122355 RepID=UPI0012FD65DC|nr:hypothetical protein [Pseudomonas psychrophila]